MAARICAPCGAFGKFMCPEDRPSPIFTMFSTILNGIGLIIGGVRLKRIYDYEKVGCNTIAREWTEAGMINYGVNIVFAWYLYIRFTSKVQAGESARQASAALFMRDWGVCLYLLFLLWEVIWIIVAAVVDGDERFCVYSITALETQQTILGIYLGFGLFVLIISYLINSCGRYGKGSGGQAPAQPPQYSANQGYNNNQYQPQPQGVHGQPVQQQQQNYQQHSGYNDPYGYNQPNRPPASNPNYGGGSAI